MQFHGLIQELFGSPVRVRVLALLLKFPTKPFTGREVARSSGTSSMAAWHAIKSLEAQGLINRTRVGKSDVLTLNTRHFLAKRMGFLAGFDQTALKELNKILMESLPKDRIKKMYLYGSVARKEERPTSDIDVLVVVKGPKDKQAVTDASGDAALKVLDAFGNALSLMAFTEDEFKRDVSLFNEVKKQGRILFDKGMEHG